MKKILYIVALGALIYSCATTQDKKLASTDNASDTLRIANDSLEYEIIIIEPGFNAWLVTQPPRGFYSEQFLEIRNQIYVTEYNQRVLQPQRYNPNLYLQQINYERGTHYGYEVNYLLYNYFLFFEREYKQKFPVTRG
ncbi:DUF6146 family protein [Aquimarina sp. 2201CG5-10]|uniref:DUF6146 family protein n=1 Tax=Aquimarina callyspongiae TaxID=3098150 RepID=UPI002AB41851|nr:DUF6146 family protein [Aquimarina sp. 2201CG5-10]MDY8135605.1 DUF6146 family protein [Aquimarina sp. 2201CG5-10]